MLLNTSLHVGFTGTRKGLTPTQRVALFAVLKEITRSTTGWTAHHGDCVGADAEFHNLSRELGMDVIIHPPSDSALRAHCEGTFTEVPKAYAKRNQDIVNDSDIIIAAPWSDQVPGFGGTWQTIRFAQDADKLYRIILPNGAIIEP